MNAYNALKAIEAIAATSSKNEKLELLDRFINDPLVCKALCYAYDPFITFGITPPHVEGEGTKEFDENDRVVWATLDGLAERVIVGNEAQDVVFKLMQQMTPSAAELFWRILSKDMRAGFTVNSINKVRPGLIRVFEVMLAHKYEERHVKGFPVRVEPKLDGVRAPCLVEYGKVEFLSRTGKPFPAVDHLKEHVLKIVEGARAMFQNALAGVDDDLRRIFWDTLGGDPSGNRRWTGRVVLDGELVSGGFNETVGAVRRQSSLATNTEYHIFDIVSLGQFKTDTVKEIKGFPHEKRRQMLQMMSEHICPPLRLVKSYIASNHDEIQMYYESFRAHGLEGAIVKPLQGAYSKKRSRAWLKMKAEETVDLLVKDVFEGAGKYENKLGGIICDFNGVDVRVGGGFSDAERESYWTDRSQVLNRMAEVEYHETTPDGSLRHPRFVRWRDDKHEQEAA